VQAWCSCSVHDSPCKHVLTSCCLLLLSTLQIGEGSEGAAATDGGEGGAAVVAVGASANGGEGREGMVRRAVLRIEGGAAPIGDQPPAAAAIGGVKEAPASGGGVEEATGVVTGEQENAEPAAVGGGASQIHDSLMSIEYGGEGGEGGEGGADDDELYEEELEMAEGEEQLT
jgi:hypothetical protein